MRWVKIGLGEVAAWRLLDQPCLTAASDDGAGAVFLVILHLPNIVHLVIVIRRRHRDIMTVIKPTRIMMNMSSFVCSCIVRIINRTRILLLQRNIVLLPWQPLRVRILAVGADILIILRRLIRIISLLFESRPSFFADE